MAVVVCPVIGLLLVTCGHVLDPPTRHPKIRPGPHNTFDPEEGKREEREAGGGRRERGQCLVM